MTGIDEISLNGESYGRNDDRPQSFTLFEKEGAWVTSRSAIPLLAEYE